MLGSDLEIMLRAQNQEVVGFSRENLDLDLPSKDLISHFESADVIVNCVAYTAVDKAEAEPEAARFANTEIPEKLAGIAIQSGSKLIHISTDYVFDGESNVPYQTPSPTNPVSIYGLTKRDGEEKVLEHEAGIVIRTSWLYGSRGKSFPKTIAKRLLDGQAMSIVNDQIGSPTHTKDLAEFIFRTAIAGPGERILHGVSSGSTSWFGFAQAIAASLDILAKPALPQELVSFAALLGPTTTDNYPTPAKRPAFSLLEPSEVDEFRIPSWHKSWEFAAPEVLGEFLEPANQSN